MAEKLIFNLLLRETLTEIAQTFDPESESPIEMQEQGWQAILKSA